MAILSRTYSDKYGVRVLRKGQQYVCETINASSTSPVEKVFANPCTNLIFRVTAGTWEIRMLSIYDKTDGKTLDDMDAITLTKGTFQVDREIVKVRFTCTDASAASPGAIWYYADGVLMLGDVGPTKYIAVAYQDSPDFSVFSWDRTSMSMSKASDHTLAGNAHKCAFSPDGTLIAVTHTSSPYFTLLSWDGASLTKADDYTLTDRGNGVSCTNIA